MVSVIFSENVCVALFLVPAWSVGTTKEKCRECCYTAGNGQNFSNDTSIRTNFLQGIERYRLLPPKTYILNVGIFCQAQIPGKDITFLIFSFEIVTTPLHLLKK